MPGALPDYDLLIVSDLHLGEGRHPDTRKFSPKEDFFFDEEFARFLDYYCDQTRWPAKKWHLIINGDFFDFLQVTSYLDAPAQFSRDPKHPEYGLGCGEQETVYKLRKIMKGHRPFFEALAGFVAAGNVVTIGKGNHDVEFHYDAVRAAFLEELRALRAEKLARQASNDRARKLERINGDAIFFTDWFYYEKGLLWVEHGNQYDELNNFKYWLAPLLPDLPGWDPKRKDEIDLPWGSLFVRYLFNRIETKEPFADNIKPQTRFVRWFLTRHPVKALRFLFRDGRYMLAKMRRAWEPVPPKAYAKREAAHGMRLRQLAAAWGIREADLQYLDSLRAPSVLKETRGLGWKVFRGMIRWRLFFPLVCLLLLLVVLGGILAAGHVLAPLIPAAVQRLLWHGSIPASAGRFVTLALSVLRWFLLPLVIVAIVWFLKRLLIEQEEKGLNYLAQRAQEIRERLGVRYVLMGHTHDADLQPLGPDRHEYFNTGTWTKVFSEGERLIREESELAFVQALRKGGGLQVKLLKWHDETGEPRLVKLFAE